MTVAYPQTNAARATLYANALFEIRIRLRSIGQIQGAPLPDLMIAESCHLQLRLSCECFAVACLAVQANFETHKTFRDEYSPPIIFRALDAEYPDFFPMPSLKQKTQEGWHFDDVGYGHAISRLELEQIWQKSGDHLHRASAKKYLKRTNVVDILAINRATERFWNLIMGHMIVLADKTSRFYTQLDRATDQIDCSFLYLDVEAGTATIENFNVTP
jgi:hypothetical protein